MCVKHSIFCFSRERINLNDQTKTNPASLHKLYPSLIQTKLAQTSQSGWHFHILFYSSISEAALIYVTYFPVCIIRTFRLERTNASKFVSPQKTSARNSLRGSVVVSLRDEKAPERMASLCIRATDVKIWSDVYCDS